MSMAMGMITFDCREPATLAGFWEKALDYEKQWESDEFVVLKGDKEGPALGFQKVPEGKTAKNRVHIDFVASDREAEVERLVGLGAKRIREEKVQDFAWTVMQDPEGNEFCVAQH